MKVKLYRWQRIIFWIIGIGYFVVIYCFPKYFPFVMEGRSYWDYTLNHVLGFVIIIITLWILFQIGNLIYRNIKKRNKVGDK